MTSHDSGVFNDVKSKPCLVIFGQVFPPEHKVNIINPSAIQKGGNKRKIYLHVYALLLEVGMTTKMKCNIMKTKPVTKLPIWHQISH